MTVRDRYETIVASHEELPRAVAMATVDLGDRFDPPLASVTPRATNTTASMLDATCARTAASGNRRIGEQHEGLEAGERVGRAVGVDGGHRAVVTGVERLEHVERLAAAHLADDEAVGTHAQRGPDQRPHRDPARTLGVGRTGLEPHDVRLREPELGRLLDGDHALARAGSPATAR